MEDARLEQLTETSWRAEPRGKQRVPVVVYGDAALVREMDQQVLVQARNVASLPGAVRAVYVMPDGHWGYGFPIGGVAAFDPREGGVVSAGGVGFDISCGVRCLLTGVDSESVTERARELADRLYRHVPVGVGSTGRVRLDDDGIDAMLWGGARWAVERGWGRSEDLERTEEHGAMSGAEPRFVSKRARERQRDQLGTLGSGNHYLEVQRISRLHHPTIAERLGLVEGQVVVSIHCGSRGLGHQIGTDFLREMTDAAREHGIELPERELACAPIRSRTGERYLGAMRAAINCALANRQVLTHLTREVFDDVLPDADLSLLYDVSHNTCKEETHRVDGHERRLFVHRKGATRAFGPGHPDLPPALADVGQPVLIGGSMGTRSYILVGTEAGMHLSLGSACHGAGRRMSRNQAKRRWKGRSVVEELRRQGIEVRSPSMRGVAEEAPGAYKDVAAVVEATEEAGLALRVAELRPLVCVKG